MSMQTFSSVATRVVGQYSQVGKFVVDAYRGAANRLVTGANTRYAAFLENRSLPLVTDAVKASLLDANQRVSGMFESGIARGSKRADQAIELVSGGVNGGIKRVASTAERVEAVFDTSAITTLGTLTMPAAQISLELANLAVNGTKRLSQRFNDLQDDIVEAPAVTKRAAKKTVRRAKASC